MTDIRVSLRITGRVQGVFFRESARREADRLGVRGWIRNDRDGSVRALAEGPREKIDDFVGWCRQGPPSAQVESLEAQESAATGEFKNFEVTR